jgi:UPF0042 nucleotide-binding protein
MKNINIIVITGLSGSGKSTAIDALEDAGYFCVDNMPVLLVPKFLELRSETGSEIQKIALGMDMREKDFLKEHGAVFSELEEMGYWLDIVFLEASEEVLVKRFSQTRRHHPAADGGLLLEGIRKERESLKGTKDISSKVIDTSNLTVHQLKKILLDYVSRGADEKRMRISVLSFGFKYGVPTESDLLIDVRFIPNPYFIPELKRLDGMDERVRQFVKKWPETYTFLEKYFSLIKFLLPFYEKEGRSYLTISVGCTGGRHRSVTIAEEIRAYISNLGMEVNITHRDMDLS